MNFFSEQLLIFSSIRLSILVFYNQLKVILWYSFISFQITPKIKVLKINHIQQKDTFFILVYYSKYIRKLIANFFMKKKWMLSFRYQIRCTSYLVFWDHYLSLTFKIFSKNLLLKIWHFILHKSRCFINSMNLDQKINKFYI